MRCFWRDQHVPRDANGRMAMELEADQRHVEVLLAELELTDDDAKNARAER